MTDRSITEITLARIQKEWTAPLQERIESLERAMRRMAYRDLICVGPHGATVWEASAYLASDNSFDTRQQWIDDLRQS